MTRAASEVMQAIIHAAVVDALEALKASAKGVPNTLLRELGTIHRNAAFADLPKEVQDAIASSTRAAFAQLLKDGYVIGPKGQVQVQRPMDRVPERERRGPPSDRRDNRKGPGRRGPGSGPGGTGGRPGGSPRGPRGPR